MSGAQTALAVLRSPRDYRAVSCSVVAGAVVDLPGLSHGFVPPSSDRVIPAGTALPSDRLRLSIDLATQGPSLRRRRGGEFLMGRSDLYGLGSNERPRDPDPRGVLPTKGGNLILTQRRSHRSSLCGVRTGSAMISGRLPGTRPSDRSAAQRRQPPLAGARRRGSRRSAARARDCLQSSWAARTVP